MLYQLGEYNTKDELSNQSKRIRNHIQKNWDFRSNYQIIREYDKLEFETVIILKKAINAGYWNSDYGLKWQKANELEFWSTVYSKSKELSISKLQYFRTLQNAGERKIEDLLNDYCDLLHSHPELYYEIMNEDLDGIWKENQKVKTSCLNAMFIHLSSDMELEEFSEEVNFQCNLHYKDEEIPDKISEVVNRIKKEKAGNIR